MDTVPAPGGELLSPHQNSAHGRGRRPHGTNVPGPAARPRGPRRRRSVTRCPVAQGHCVAACRRLPRQRQPSGSRPAAGEIAAPRAGVRSRRGSIIGRLPPRRRRRPTPLAACRAGPPSGRRRLAVPASAAEALQSANPPAGLQNGPAIADNQPGKNTVGKTAGPSAPSRRSTARAAHSASGSKRRSQGRSGEANSAGQVRPRGTRRQAHPAETPAQSTPQAVPTAARSRPAVTPMPPADRTQMLAQVTHGLEVMTAKPAAPGRSR